MVSLRVLMLCVSRPRVSVSYTTIPRGLGALPFHANTNTNTTIITMTTELTYVDNWEITWLSRGMLGPGIMYHIRGDHVSNIDNLHKGDGDAKKDTSNQMKFESTYLDFHRLATKGVLPDTVPYLPCRLLSQNLCLLRPNAEFANKVQVEATKLRLKLASLSAADAKETQEQAKETHEQAKETQEQAKAAVSWLQARSNMDIKKAPPACSSAVVNFLFDQRPTAPMIAAYRCDPMMLDLSGGSPEARATMRADGLRLLRCIPNQVHELTGNEAAFVEKVLEGKCTHWSAEVDKTADGETRYHWFFDKDKEAAPP